MRRRTPKVHGWVSDLEGDRLEVFVRARNIPDRPDLKVRASGTADAMNALLDWIEQQIDRRIDLPHSSRVRRSQPPMAGQLSLEEVVTPGLSSDATLPA